MKTYWLSFCDDAKPEGQRFLGVCVVDVTPEDAILAKVYVDEHFPKATEGAEWILAATRAAWDAGCNPGGSVATTQLPSDWPMIDTCPRNELMSRERMFELGLIEEEHRH